MNFFFLKNHLWTKGTSFPLAVDSNFPLLMETGRSWLLLYAKSSSSYSFCTFLRNFLRWKEGESSNISGCAVKFCCNINLFAIHPLFFLSPCLGCFSFVGWRQHPKKGPLCPLSVGPWVGGWLTIWISAVLKWSASSHCCLLQSLHCSNFNKSNYSIYLIRPSSYKQQFSGKQRGSPPFEIKRIFGVMSGALPRHKIQTHIFVPAKIINSCMNLLFLFTWLFWWEPVLMSK